MTDGTLGVLFPHVQQPGEFNLFKTVTETQPFKRQTHKMVKHTQIIRRQYCKNDIDFLKVDSREEGVFFCPSLHR